MIEAERKRQIFAESQPALGLERSRRQREEAKLRRGGFQKFTFRRRRSRPAGRKWPHLVKWMPIKMNDNGRLLRENFHSAVIFSKFGLIQILIK